MENLLKLDTDKEILHVTEEMVNYCESMLSVTIKQKNIHNVRIKIFTNRYELPFEEAKEIYTLVRYFELQLN